MPADGSASGSEQLKYRATWGPCLRVESMINAPIKRRRAFAGPCWHIDHRALQPGDVILEAGATLFGAAIRKIDRGTYSHALMWIGNTDFVEAVAGGSRVISFARVLVTKPARWLLLRHPRPDAARAAATEARNLAHKNYALGKALGTKLPVPASSSPTSLFCSQLVAEAYARAGAPLVAGKAPAKVTPNDLVRASSLQDIGVPPLVEVTPEAAVQHFLNRDGAYRGSLPVAERRIAMRAFAAVRPLARKLSPEPGNLVETLQGLADSPANHSELAAALLEALEQRGYFSLLDGLMLDIAQGQAPVGSAEHIAGWRVSAERHQDEWRKYTAIANRSPYPIWKRFAQLYLRNHLLFAALIEGSTAANAAPAPRDED